MQLHLLFILIPILLWTCAYCNPTPSSTKGRSWQSSSKSAESVNEEDKVNECAICLEPIYKEYEPRLPCGHRFCNDCLTNWLKRSKSCPSCRAKIIKWEFLPYNKAKMIFRKDKKATDLFDFLYVMNEESDSKSLIEKTRLEMIHEKKVKTINFPSKLPDDSFGRYLYAFCDEIYKDQTFSLKYSKELYDEKKPTLLKMREEFERYVAYKNPEKHEPLTEPEKKRMHEKLKKEANENIKKLENQIMVLRKLWLALSEDVMEIQNEENDLQKKLHSSELIKKSMKLAKLFAGEAWEVGMSSYRFVCHWEKKIKKWQDKLQEETIQDFPRIVLLSQYMLKISSETRRAFKSKITNLQAMRLNLKNAVEGEKKKKR